MPEPCTPEQFIALREQIAALRERVATLEAKQAASEREVAGAKADLDRRLLSMNEFRAQISQERAEYMRRGDYEHEHKTLLLLHTTDIARIDKDIANLRESRSWAGGSLAAYASVVAFLISIATMVILLTRH